MKAAIDKLDDTDLNGRRIRLVEDRGRGGGGGSRSKRSRSSSRSRSRSRSRRRDSRSRYVTLGCTFSRSNALECRPLQNCSWSNKIGQRASRSRGARAKAKVDPNQSQNPVPSKYWIGVYCLTAL